METLTLDEIIDQWGAVYTNQGQTIQDIKVQLFAPDDLSSYFAKRPEKNDQHKGIYATAGEVMQAFAIPFTPKGASEFKPWVTELGEFKIEALFLPDKFRASYLGFLATIEEVDRSKWPVLMWYVKNKIIPRNTQDFINQVAFWGWKKTGWATDPDDPTVDGTTFERELRSENNPNGQPANATMDGVNIQLIKMHAAGRSQMIATGALSATATTFCTQVEDMFAAVDPILREQLDFAFMSINARNKYREGRRQKYNLNYAQVEDLDMIKDTNMKVVGTRAMTGSAQIWATPAENRVYCMHTDNTGKFDVQKLDRTVKMLSDDKKLLTFDVPELVIHTDQEITITSGMILARYTEAELS